MSLETLHIAAISETQSVVTASPDAAQIFDPSNPWGHVYHSVLGGLGFNLEVDGESAKLTGEMAVVQNRIIVGGLARKIADIAQQSGQLAPHPFQAESQEGIALRELHGITTRTLPEFLEATTTFNEASARITAQIGFALLAPRQASITTSSLARAAA